MSLLRSTTLSNNRVLRLVLCAGLIFLAISSHAYIPERADKYKSYLIRQARFEYGLNAPIALLASQIHQESAWRADVSSPYADGLTQFTPSTAKWITEVYPELEEPRVFNPKWAIRAMVKYDKHLFNNFDDAASACHRWAFTLSAYNGGYSWVRKDQKIADREGDDPSKWWDNVEKYSNRADWAFEENRDYPRKILYKHQPKYVKNRWGSVTVCPQEGPKEEENTEEADKVEKEKEVEENPPQEKKKPWWYFDISKWLKEQYGL